MLHGYSADITSLLFLLIILDTSYLRIYSTDIHQFFGIDRHMGGNDKSGIHSRDIAIVTGFGGKSAKIGICQLHSLHVHSRTYQSIGTVC